MVHFCGALPASAARRSSLSSLAGEAALHCFGSEFPLQLLLSMSNNSYTQKHTHFGLVRTEHVQQVRKLINGGIKVNFESPNDKAPLTLALLFKSKLQDTQSRSLQRPGHGDSGPVHFFNKAHESIKTSLWVPSHKIIKM